MLLLDNLGPSGHKRPPVHAARGLLTGLDAHRHSQAVLEPAPTELVLVVSWTSNRPEGCLGRWFYELSNSQASKARPEKCALRIPSACLPHSAAGTELPAPRPDQRLVAVGGSWDRPQQVGTGLGRAGGGRGEGEAASRSPCARDSRWPLTSGVRARRGGLYVRVVLRFLGLCLQHLSGSGRGRRGSCGAAGPGALRHGPVFLPLRRSPFIIQSARSAPRT